MQAMLNVLSDYANKHRYIISSQKSCNLQYGSKTEHLFTLNGQPLQNVIKATHLGIDHDVNSKYGVKDCVPSRIQTTARKTVYALMGAGLHGLNGLNPKIRCT